VRGLGSHFSQLLDSLVLTEMNNPVQLLDSEIPPCTQDLNNLLRISIKHDDDGFFEITGLETNTMLRIHKKDMHLLEQACRIVINDGHNGE